MLQKEAHLLVNLVHFTLARRSKVSSTPLKPTISEAHTFLRRHHALIVHFSGAPKGAGKERGASHLFPADLLHVIKGRAMGGVSCSVVRPGDNFRGFSRNATGCIGVVLDLKTDASLVAADPHDCGSIEDEHGNRIVQKETDISADDLENTLTERPTDSYNEWVVRDYAVCGIFAIAPFDVAYLEVPDYPDEMPDFMKDFQPSPDIRQSNFGEVDSLFQDQAIYTFKDEGIFRYTPHELIVSIR